MTDEERFIDLTAMVAAHEFFSASLLALLVARTKMSAAEIDNWKKEIVATHRQASVPGTSAAFSDHFSAIASETLDRLIRYVGTPPQESGDSDRQ